MLGDLEWHRFANGDFEEPIRVCRLPLELVSILRAADDRLLVHPRVAGKIVHKHGLTPERLALLPIAIEFGSVFIDFDGSLVFAYEERVMTGKVFLAAVKTTTERHEIWLRSFYAVRNKDYERKRKRMTIYRIQQQ